MNPIAKRKAPQNLKTVLLLLLALPMVANAQSDLTAIVKGSEVLVSGLISIFSSSKKHTNTMTVESVCIKNKMNRKITLVITRQTEDGEELKKELVIPADSKECFYELPKGVYTYEILLANDEIYKKGEYLFREKTVITLKEDPKEIREEPKPGRDETGQETKTPIE